jgi:hypothetical protein
VLGEEEKAAENVYSKARYYPRSSSVSVLLEPFLSDRV